MEIEEAIEQNWRALVQVAPSTFNGQCYRLLTYDASETLTLSLGMLSYKEVKGLPLDYVSEHCTEEFYPQSLSCSIFLETTDGKIIFGKKGELHRIIGGIYSPEELTIDNGDDIYTMPKVEISQETGIPSEYVQHLRLHGLVRTSNLNAALVFRGVIPFSKIEVEHFFNKGHDPELDTLVFTPSHQLEEYFHTSHPKRLALLQCIQ